MNKDRRERLQEALDKLNNMDINGVTELVRDVADEEREVADNMEEHFPGTERAETTGETAGELEEVADSLEQIDFDAVIQQIEGAIET
jgi:methyl-accepting chemotaxis protein